MEQVDEYVQAFVTPTTLKKRDHRREWVLQYVLCNCGMESVKVLVDFRDSANVELVLPPTTQKTSVVMSAPFQLECELQPLERVLLVCVRKKGDNRQESAPSARAFVRTQYTIVERREIQVERIDQICHANATQMAQLVLKMRSIFNSFPKNVVSRSDINSFFRRRLSMPFVDPAFPPTMESLVSEDVQAGRRAVYALCVWNHLCQVVDGSYCIFQRSSQRSSGLSSAGLFTQFASGWQDQHSFVAAVSILASKKKMFVDKYWKLSVQSVTDIRKGLAAASVWLCESGCQWQEVVIDLFVPCFPGSNGIMTIQNPSGELYGTLLHKAFAKVKGSFHAISMMSTHSILRELSGLPWINVVDGATANSVDSALPEWTQVVENLLGVHRNEPPAYGERLLAVSFEKIDQGFVWFPLLDLLPETEELVVGDVGGILTKELAATEVSTVDHDKQHGQVRAQWSTLRMLSPRIWEGLNQMTHMIRRRTFRCGDITPSPTTGSHDPVTRATSTRMALSVSRLTTMFVSVARRTYSSAVAPVNNQQLKIYSVNEDFTGTEINSQICLQPRSKSTVEQQIMIAVPPGEYILVLEQETSEISTMDSLQVDAKTALSPDTCDENIQLLFQCIDQDMDGRISVRELHDFICRIEQQSCVSVEAVFSAMDQVVCSPPTSEPVLRSSAELLELYARRISSPRRPQRDDDDLHTVVWEDLSLSVCNVIRETIVTTSIEEIVWCVHTDKTVPACALLP